MGWLKDYVALVLLIKHSCTKLKVECSSMKWLSEDPPDRFLFHHSPKPSWRVTIIAACVFGAQILVWNNGMLRLNQNESELFMYGLVKRGVMGAEAAWRIPPHLVRASAIFHFHFFLRFPFNFQRSRAECCHRGRKYINWEVEVFWPTWS